MSKSSPAPHAVIVNFNAKNDKSYVERFLVDNSKDFSLRFQVTSPKGMRQDQEDKSDVLYLDDGKQAYFYFWGNQKEYDGLINGEIKLASDTKYYVVKTKTDLTGFEHTYSATENTADNWVWFRYHLSYGGENYMFYFKIREDKLTESRDIMNNILASVVPTTVTREYMDRFLGQ